MAPGIKTEGAFPHGFLRITAIRRCPNDIVLKAMVQRIDPATQSKLIAAYEEAAPKSPTDEEIAGLPKDPTGRNPAPGRTSHVDTRTDNLWMKHEADVALLEGSSEFIGHCG